MSERDLKEPVPRKPNNHLHQGSQIPLINQQLVTMDEFGEIVQ